MVEATLPPRIGAAIGFMMSDPTPALHRSSGPQLKMTPKNGTGDNLAQESRDLLEEHARNDQWVENLAFSIEVLASDSGSG